MAVTEVGVKISTLTLMGTSTRNSYQATYVEVRFSSTDLAQKIRVIDKVIHRRKSSGQLAITVNAKFRVDGDGTFSSSSSLSFHSNQLPWRLLVYSSPRPPLHPHHHTHIITPTHPKSQRLPSTPSPSPWRLQLHATSGFSRVLPSVFGQFFRRGLFRHGPLPPPPPRPPISQAARSRDGY